MSSLEKNNDEALLIAAPPLAGTEDAPPGAKEGAGAAPGGNGHGHPAVMPVLPLSDLVLFPSMIAPLVVNTRRSIKLVEEAMAGDRLFIAVLQKDREIPDDRVKPEHLHEHGCLARLLRILKFPDDTVRVLVQGETRCKIVSCRNEEPYLQAHYVLCPDEIEKSVELDALARNASQRFQEVITMSPTLPEELKVALFNIDDPGRLSDLVASNLNMDLADRQKLLEEPRVKARLVQLTALLNREREVLRLGSEIQSKVSETFSKSQREYFLREQMNAIRQELGEKDQQQSEQDDLKKKIAAAHLTEEAQAVAAKEIERLAAIPPASPEYGVIRTYLDWLSELPWAVQTEDVLDIRAARKILDHDHYDLAKIKDRILEYLAVLKLKPDMKGPILCFAGPPGVGKTSLGQSIARAMGRKFIRMSLGGVHDEAEIRGHRRTYIGAMPGRILQGLRRAGTRNPVCMLDEVDKIGMDFRGDPASALLEVLDPEQNSTFVDHYLDVAFDLSQVIFITTANRLDTIPPALRDRMEVLDLAGYGLNEKLQIAKKHLLRKQIEEHGLKKRQVTFQDEAIVHLIEAYTREAGVRNLERELANICRKIARGVAEGRNGKITVTPARVRAYLGPRKFESETAERRAEPGVATGLAWTPTGGDILFIEVNHMVGKGQLILTGLLGDVMKESARAALSYVRANEARFGLDPEFAEKQDLHIHVPAGAIPKDGPSAGLALTLALISMMIRKPIPADLAMSGEITLRGRVMPVGGIKEKVLAASRAGIRRLILPVKNRDDLHEIAPDIRRKLEFHFVRTIDAALRLVWPEGARAEPARAPARKPPVRSKDVPS